MTPRKLSESDKQNILHLYRHPGETTSTLAERYGVSNTTISRVLKSLLPEQEYEALVQQKRAARPQAGFAEFAAELAFEEEAVEENEVAQSTPTVAEVETVAEAVVEAVVEEDEPIEENEAAIAELTLSPETTETVTVDAVSIEAIFVESMAAPATKSAIAPPITRRQRKRSSVADEAGSAESIAEEPEVIESQLQLLDIPAAAPEVEKKPSKAPPVVKTAATPSMDVAGTEITREILADNLQAQAAAELMGLEDEDDDLDDDDLDDDDLDDLDDLDDEDEDDDEGDLDDAGSFMGSQLQAKAFVRVLPLAEAAIPKTFYLVVDRMAELITRPLREFGDLGQIPSEDIQAKTLPIFDNHRVARRFSKRNQRVIKVPDGRMLPKVSGYLQAKGITRLLIDGQVYSL
jgi:transposase-like protein